MKGRRHTKKDAETFPRIPRRISSAERTSFQIESHTFFVMTTQPNRRLDSARQASFPLKASSSTGEQALSALLLASPKPDESSRQTHEAPSFALLQMIFSSLASNLCAFFSRFVSSCAIVNTWGGRPLVRKFDGKRGFATTALFQENARIIDGTDIRGLTRENATFQAHDRHNNGILFALFDRVLN